MNSTRNCYKFPLFSGDRTLIGTATATACHLLALPPPTMPRLTCSPAWQNDPHYLQRTQTRLEDRVAENKSHYGIHSRSRQPSAEDQHDDHGELANGGDDRDPAEDADLGGFGDHHDFDLLAGNKDTCVLEVSVFVCILCSDHDANLCESVNPVAISSATATHVLWINSQLASHILTKCRLYIL